jgi:hypothetical protein
MALQKAPPAEIRIRKRGIEALAKALGPVGLVRFLQQFELGSGDYTRDREEWLKGLTVSDVVEKIKSSRKKPSS